MITGVIYQLIANNNHELFYIGSSVDAERRETEHNAGLITGTTYVYEKLREIGGGFTFIVLLEMACKTITELRAEEVEWIIEMKPPLNSVKYEYKKRKPSSLLKQEYVFPRQENTPLQENTIPRQENTTPRQENTTPRQEWKRKIKLFINDLKTNPPIEREWISVFRKCPHKNGKSYSKEIIVWKDEIKLTDIPVWGLRNTKGVEIQ